MDLGNPNAYASLEKGMRILAQFAPVGTGWEAAYTVPAGRGVLVDSVQVANREAAAPLVIGIAFAPGGAADAVAQHFIEGFSIELGSAGADALGTPIKLGVRLAAGDVIRVKADGDATFTFLSV